MRLFSLRLGRSGQADDLPKDVAHLFVGESLFARDRSRSANHLRFTRRIQRRHSGDALQRSDFLAAPHAAREESDQLTVDLLDHASRASQRLASGGGISGHLGVGHAAAPAADGRAPTSVRPAASAKAVSRAIINRKASNESDWSPSDNALAGSGCTSTIRSSAPAAMAANESGATRSEMPPAWLGSTITGRCVSRLSTGTAATSRVLRVAFSKVRMPRSQSTTSRFP